MWVEYFGKRTFFQVARNTIIVPIALMFSKILIYVLTKASCYRLEKLHFAVCLQYYRDEYGCYVFPTI